MVVDIYARKANTIRRKLKENIGNTVLERQLTEIKEEAQNIENFFGRN